MKSIHVTMLPLFLLGACASTASYDIGAEITVTLPNQLYGVVVWKITPSRRMTNVECGFEFKEEFLDHAGHRLPDVDFGTTKHTYLVPLGSLTSCDTPATPFIRMIDVKKSDLPNVRLGISRIVEGEEVGQQGTDAFSFFAALRNKPEVISVSQMSAGRYMINFHQSGTFYSAEVHFNSKGDLLDTHDVKVWQ